MDPKIVIRSETDADVSAISEVTIAAFRTLEISEHTEQFVIEALRAANALTISLVAELDGRVIGLIAFSPVTISDGTQNWYGLGPVSVLPACQRQGIGKALIREGLSRLVQLESLALSTGCLRSTGRRLTMIHRRGCRLTSSLRGGRRVESPGRPSSPPPQVQIHRIVC